MDSGAGTILLRLDRVSFRYDGGPPVLSDLDLAVTAGSSTLVVGPSGAGKTTLLHLMSLSHAPTTGMITLFGRDVRRLQPAARTALRARLGVIHQDLRLLPHLSAFDNVALPLRLAGMAEDEVLAEVGEAMTAMELGDLLERRPDQLSAGQRQMVAAARALVIRPSLLIADEPTAAMDAGLAARLLGVLAARQRAGMALVMATHGERRLVREATLPRLELAYGRLRPAAACPATLLAAE